MLGLGNRSELQKTVEIQQAQIEKYEKKLKDVIHAYKSLLVEKQALEQSLQALSSGSPGHSSKNFPEQQPQEKKDGDEEQTAAELQEVSQTKPTEFSAKEQQHESEDSDASSVTLAHSTKRETTSEDRIATLKHALRTLTHEKSRVEAALAADKKKLLDELSALRVETAAQRSELEKNKSLADQQLNEVRASLRQSHCERECEQSDHAAMLKELQQKLAQERLQNEHMQKEISSLKKDLEGKQEEPFIYQDRIGELSAEVSRLKNELQATEQEAKQAPHLFQLQKEMQELKVQHKVALEQEQKRALLAEAQITKINLKSEDRVNSLETKTSELSAMLGNYERQRQQDLAVIEKLKVRTQQLDQENTALTKAAGRGSLKDEDWASLTEKLKKIGSSLKTTQPPMGTTLNFYELLGLDSPDAENGHKKCRADVEALKDEFEKYKLRAQAVLKTKAQQRDGSDMDSGTAEHLRSVIVSLQQKLQEAETDVSRTEVRYQDTVNGLRHTIAEMQTSHDRDLAELRQNAQQRINDAEREMHKQRERTLEVLSEKEQELEAMRTILSTLRDGNGGGSVPTDPRVKERAAKHHQQQQHSPGAVSDSGGEASAGEMTKKNPSDRASSPESEKEITYLRKDVRQLESAMRDLQHSAVTKELQHYDTIEKLKEEIRALEGKLRLYSEDANLEYLKNVVVKYMLCESPPGKDHMLKAIAVVLKLSQKELDMIRKHNASWYWWSNKKN